MLYVLFFFLIFNNISFLFYVWHFSEIYRFKFLIDNYFIRYFNSNYCYLGVVFFFLIFGFFTSTTFITYSYHIFLLYSFDNYHFNFTLFLYFLNFFVLYHFFFPYLLFFLNSFSISFRFNLPLSFFYFVINLLIHILK